MSELDFIVGEDLVGERLDRAIARVSSSLSNRQAKLLVGGGAAHVDGELERRASRILSLGQHVRASLSETSGVPMLVDLRDAVIFRDDWLIAISKPSGLPTHATHEPTVDHALDAVKRLLAEGDAEPYVAVHHRLDVQTSGVLLFAIDRAANKGLADAFADRVVRKTYLALVGAASLEDRFTVENQLARMRHNTKQMGEVKKGDFASTAFELLDSSPLAALVEARPRTGRTHQIRVHLRGSGAPILGDALYGGPLSVGDVRAPRVMLHAHRLELPHPVTGEPLSLTAAPPEDFSELAAQLGLEGAWKRT